MTFVNTWKEPKSKTTYICTGKEPSPAGDKVDLACWILCGKIDDAFHGEPATVGDIYYQVTRPMGMSLDETAQLVKGCKQRGFLR